MKIFQTWDDGYKVLNDNRPWEKITANEKIERLRHIMFRLTILFSLAIIGICIMLYIQITNLNDTVNVLKEYMLNQYMLQHK